MRRALLIALVASVAIGLPGGASAAGWRGVVVAKDTSRGSVVTASRGGVIRTVRVAGRLSGLRIGQRVLVRALSLADGTFRAERLRVVGRAAQARIRATVVRHQAGLDRTIVSAGGSVFALRSASFRRLSHAGDDELDPGDRIVVHVRLEDGELEADDVDEVGHAGLLELEGIFLETAGSTLKVAVLHRGLVLVTVPGGFALPALAAGDQIELLASVGADGSLALVTLRAEDEDEALEEVGIDLDEDEEAIEVEGTLTSFTATSATVQPGLAASAVTCGLPVAFLFPGFLVGADVEMECTAGLSLRELEQGRLKLELEDGTLELRAEGTVVGTPGSSLTVYPLGASPVTCLVPLGFSLGGAEAGDMVEVRCRPVGGQLLLTRLEFDHEDNSGPGNAEDEEDNSGPGSGDDGDDDHSGPGGGDDSDH